jgi:hypothetical protein
MAVTLIDSESAINKGAEYNPMHRMLMIIPYSFHTKGIYQPVEV